MVENQPTQPQSIRRYIPNNDAEFAAHVTKPSWADRVQAPNLDMKVTQKYFLTDEQGNLVKDKEGKNVEISESLLTLYEMFTQDIRLGNLDLTEIEFCRIYIDVAHDLMQSGYKGAALVAMERAISVIETSHSKRGWFRRLLGTIRSENAHEMFEPSKSFWKGGKDKQ